MLRKLVTSKKPLVIVPVVLALVLAGLFLPVKVSIEPYGRLSLESKITLSIGYEVAYASPGWVSPTGFVDGGSVWTDGPLAYDEDTLTFASVSCPLGWCDYLELTIAEITCDKVQLWMGIVNTQVTDVEIDVYYNSAWATIYSGAIVVGSFQEFAIGSEQLVTAMRIRFSASKASRQAEIYEADFNDVSLVPDITNTPTSKAFGTVSTSTDYWSNGSAPVWPLDNTECYFTVTNNSSAAVDIDIRATDFSGGTPSWTLGATPSADTVVLKAGKSGDLLETNMVVLTTTPLSFITALPDTTSNTIMWELKMETPTSFSNGDPKEATITLTATF